MEETKVKTQAFKLKGRIYTITVLQLLDTNLELFLEQIHETVKKAPRLFNKTPVVLDLSLIKESFDLKSLCRVLREKNLIPVGAQGGAPFLSNLAAEEGLALLKASSSQDKILDDYESAFKNHSDVTTLPRNNHGFNHEVRWRESKLVTTPIRSGQQVVCKDGDLVVTSSVSQGAELLANGHIHVYGTLRGRALAGIGGDLTARIFCQTLEAELVSIAGCYRLPDAITPSGGPCQIYLQDGHIYIESLL